MRLIDADALINTLGISNCDLCRFGGDYCAECKDIDAHKVLATISNQPTTYDVDRVLDELDHSAENYEYIAINKEKAIEIVKRGGIDDYTRGGVK